MEHDLLSAVMENIRIKSAGIALKDNLHFAGTLIGGTIGGMNAKNNPYSSKTDVLKGAATGALIGAGSVAATKAIIEHAPAAAKEVKEVGQDLKAVRAIRKAKD